MIHSLAGGTIKKKSVNNFVKVKINSSNLILWYISDLEVQEGDYVQVPLGRNNDLVIAEVIRVDKNVPSDVSPINPKYAKNIYDIVKKK